MAYGIVGGLSGRRALDSIVLAALVAVWARPGLVQAASLRGYVFREADGSPPRRPLTIELAQNGKARHRQTTREDGAFEFPEVAAGSYTIVPRIRDFVLTQEAVTVSAAGPNFSAVMLPKRRASVSRFGTVSVDQLSRRNTRQTQKKLKEADQLLQRRDVAGAARRYEEAVQLRPSAEILDALALLYLQQGRKEEAYRTFEQAIALDARFLFPYSHLAGVYLEEGKPREVAAVATHALQVDPKWAGAHLLLGEAQVRLGDLEGAARHARAASELMQEKSPDPHLLWAKIRWARNDCRAAREDLGRYLNLRTSARTLPEFRKLMETLEACP